MLKIWQEKEEPEPDVYLRLVRVDYGIVLWACDRAGQPILGGKIRVIRDDGTYYRSIGCDLPGVQADVAGRIIESQGGR